MKIQLNVGAIEEKVTAGGKKYMAMRAADSHEYGGTTTTTWYSISYWGKNPLPDISKGDRIEVDGRLELKAYAKKDSTLAVDARIAAFEVKKLERKVPAPATEGATSTASAGQSFDDMDDDIPF